MGVIMKGIFLNNRNHAIKCLSTTDKTTTRSVNSQWDQALKPFAQDSNLK